MDNFIKAYGHRLRTCWGPNLDLQPGCRNIAESEINAGTPAHFVIADVEKRHKNRSRATSHGPVGAGMATTVARRTW